MNRSRFNLIWLVLPSIVFFLLVAFFVVRLSRQSQNATQAPVGLPPAERDPVATPGSDNGLSSLVQQIAGWQVSDPRLATPTFDRRISLPYE